MTREHPLEARLRAHWGSLRPLLRAPAGRLMLAGQDTEGSHQLIQLILPTTSEAALIQHLERFLQSDALPQSPGFLAPDDALVHEGLPALTYPVSGEVTLLPVMLQDPGMSWPLQRFIGQLIPMVRGLIDLHDQGSVHGSIAPISVAVERTHGERFLRLISNGLWRPLQDAGLTCSDILGAGSKTLSPPNPADDIQAFGQLLDWLRGALATKTEEPWPLALSDLSARCQKTETSPNALRIFDELQGILAGWRTLAPDPELGDGADPHLDSVTGSTRNIRVELHTDSDTTLNSSPIKRATRESVTVRAATVVGEGEPDPENAQSLASLKGPKNTAQLDLDWDNLIDEEESAGATTLVINLNKLSGLFDGIDAPDTADAPTEADDEDAPEASTSASQTARLSVIGKGAAKKQEQAIRTDLNPENEVLTSEHVLRSEYPRQGSGNPLIIALVAIVVVIVVLLLWRFVIAAPAAMILPQPATVSHPAGAPRVVLANRSSSAPRTIAVSPTGDTYALCDGDEVQLWSTRREGAQRLDRFSRGAVGCEQLSYTPDGRALIVTTRSTDDAPKRLWRYDITTATATPISFPERVARWRQARPLSPEQFAVEDHARRWWLVTAKDASRLPLEGTWRLCEGNSSAGLLLSNGAKLAWFDAAQSRVTRSFEGRDDVAQCAVSPDGLEASLLVEPRGVLRWPLALKAPLAKPLLGPEMLQGHSEHAQLRYRDEHRLSIAAGDRVIELLTPFSKPESVTTITETVSGGERVPMLSTYDGHASFPLRGQHAVVIFDGVRADIHELGEGQTRASLEPEPSMVHYQSVFTNDGGDVVSTYLERGRSPDDILGPDGLIVRWDLNALTVAATHPLNARPLMFSPSPDGEHAAMLLAQDPERVLIEKQPPTYTLVIVRLSDLSWVSNASLAARPERSTWSHDGRFLMLEDQAHARLLFPLEDGNLGSPQRSDATSSLVAFHAVNLLLEWSATDGLRGHDLGRKKTSAPLISRELFPPSWHPDALSTHPSQPIVVFTTNEQATWARLPQQGEPARVQALEDSGPVETVRFSPDGLRLWAGKAIFDSATAERISTLVSVPPAQSVFSPDGEWLIHGDRAWSLSDGQVVERSSALSPGRWEVEQDPVDLLHPLGWALTSSGGIVRSDHPEQRLTFAIDGPDAWAIASQNTAVASEAGRHLIGHSDGFRRSTPSQPADVNDIERLKGLLGVTDWSAPRSTPSSAKIAASFPVSLTITSSPPAADVWLQASGLPRRWLGKTPIEVELPASGLKAQLRLEKSGHLPIDYAWTADNDLTLGITLRTALDDAEERLIELRGGLQPSEIVDVIAARREDVRACASVNARLDPGVQPSRAVISWKISPEGRATDPSAASAMPSFLRRCLAEALSRWSFPSRSEPSVVRYHFLLDRY